MTRAPVTTILALVGLSILIAAKAQAHPAWGIAVDRQGQVYFSDLVTVWKIDAKGKLSVFRGAGDGHIHDLNIDEAGNLYGAENSYEPATKRFFSAVWKMTPAGVSSYLLARTENPPKGTSIWTDRDGNMYHVTNYPEGELLVLKRAPNGNVTALAGSSNALRDYRQGGPYSIGGIAFGADGALYFTHGANFSKVTMDGTFTALARNLVVENAPGNPVGGGAPTRLFGIAIDEKGNALVADHGNQRVLKFTPDNQITTLIRGEESWFPTGIALRGGETYILEYRQNRAQVPIGTRVRKLSPDGRVTILATVEENGTPYGNPSAGENSERTAKSNRNIPYALAAVGIGVLALTIIVWLVWRRMYHSQRSLPSE